MKLNSLAFAFTVVLMIYATMLVVRVLRYNDTMSVHTQLLVEMIAFAFGVFAYVIILRKHYVRVLTKRSDGYTPLSKSADSAGSINGDLELK